MTITVENTDSSIGENESNLSFSYALQTASGNNRLVLVLLAYNQSVERDTTAVTFNGVAMTEISLSPRLSNTAQIEAWLIDEADLPASAGSYTVATTVDFLETWVGAVLELSSDVGALSVAEHDEAAVNASAGALALELSSAADLAVLWVGIEDFALTAAGIRINTSGYTTAENTESTEAGGNDTEALLAYKASESVADVDSFGNFMRGVGTLIGINESGGGGGTANPWYHNLIQ